MNFSKTIVASIFIMFSTFTLSLAESRLALLIGNSDYPRKSLSNPGNDVDLLAKSLTSLGFKVIKEKNLIRSQMLSSLRSFYNQIDDDTIALIYFSGHGVHSTIDNLNYLIPIDAFDSLINEEDLSNEALSDGKLLASTSGAKFSILLLDACRSNDFTKTRGDKGLGQPSSKLANDYVISYATEVGKTAEDGSSNSPYALALSQYLAQSYSIGDTFTKVRQAVSRETKGKQQPYYAPHFENILYLGNDIKKYQQTMMNVAYDIRYDKNYKKFVLDSTEKKAWFKDITYRLWSKQITPKDFITEGLSKHPKQRYEFNFIINEFNKYR